MSKWIYASVLYDVSYSADALRTIINLLSEAVEGNWCQYPELRHLEPNALRPDAERWLPLLSLDQLEEEHPIEKEDRLKPIPSIEPETRWWSRLPFRFTPHDLATAEAGFHWVNVDGGRIGVTLFIRRTSLFGLEEPEGLGDALGEREICLTATQQEFQHLHRRLQEPLPVREVDVEFDDDMGWPYDPDEVPDAS